VANTYRYERVEGAGHWMQWEQPDAVSSLLIDFLPR
jgi:pimeloyl-ACP methyl ester carboxylesterase